MTYIVSYKNIVPQHT